VLRKEDDDWVKKFAEYEVEDPRQRKAKEDLGRGCPTGLSSM